MCCAEAFFGFALFDFTDADSDFDWLDSETVISSNVSATIDIFKLDKKNENKNKEQL